MRRSARDDLDVGQPEPRSAVATDDSKAMGGQQAPEIGRHSGMEMTHPWPGRAAVSLVGKDVGNDEHPTRSEHAANLGDPGRWVRPVPQGQGGEHEVEHLMGERQVLGAGADIADSQLGGGDRDRRRNHLRGQVDAHQGGRGVARSCPPQELSGATANIKDSPRLGHQLERELQGSLLGRAEPLWVR